jgi:hypothetical protein
MNFNDHILSATVKAVFFPLLFQSAFISFAWGAGDQSWLVAAKRLFLLLPACAVLLACWASIASVLSIPIRRNRQVFITALFVTWWDLGKSVLSFWGGMFRFVVELLMAAVAVSRVLLLGVWAIVHDVLLMPFNYLRWIAGNVVRSPIPWIAVSLTIAWCAVETTIFTYVMSPVVIDTFSNITGETLREGFIRTPLFLFLFFIVMGSYAVLSTFVDSVKSKSLQQISGIVVIECVVIFVEVVFLYREFVDSLVPWFAQYSSNFELGIFWTLAISGFVWLGIRSLSWFLFAAHGTPTIMAVIQGRGVDAGERTSVPNGRLFDMSEAYLDRTRQDANWMRQLRESLLASFMLPPLQVVAAAVNFCTLCLLNKHLFSLPFENMEAMKYSEKLIRDFKKRSGFHAPSPPGPSKPKVRSFERELDPESVPVTIGES